MDADHPDATAPPSATDGDKDGDIDGATDLTTATQAALTGEPDTLPVTWCKRCEVNVTPTGKGQCPRCYSFLKLNFVARRHPINKLRKQQLLDKLVADYHPQTTLARSSCEVLAGILEQLEVLKPGSPDHQRLVQLSQQLGTALDASRSVPPYTTADFANASPDDVVARIEKLLELALLVRDGARGELSRPIPPREVAQGATRGAPAAGDTGSPPADSEAPASEAPAPAPEPTSEAPTHAEATPPTPPGPAPRPAWAAAQAAREATRAPADGPSEMLESLRRHGPGWWPRL
jgi:hypothetical protein